MAMTYTAGVNPPAYMGFVGFVKIVPSTSGAYTISDVPHLIRTTSADINLKQDVTTPDVIDSRYDRTVYQLGPMTVDGSVSFPAIYQLPNNATYTPFELMYRYAATRSSGLKSDTAPIAEGGLNQFDMMVKYASSFTEPNEAEFNYKNCIVNTWKFSVNQSDLVTCDVDIIGINREDIAGTMKPPCRSDNVCSTSGSNCDSTEGFSIGTTRVVTWNDARVQLGGPDSSSDGDNLFATNDNTLGYIGGEYIRTFEANINNDAERFYTLNAHLYAQAIAPRKREVSGSMTLMGRHQTLSNIAVNNQLNCTANSTIKFGYVLSVPGSGVGCTGLSGFNTTFPNVVFEIETMSLTNDLFESTVNWKSLPGAGTGVCDPLVDSCGNTSFSYDDDQPVP
jgi:hypothetical protein